MHTVPITATTTTSTPTRHTSSGSTPLQECTMQPQPPTQIDLTPRASKIGRLVRRRPFLVLFAGVFTAACSPAPASPPTSAPAAKPTTAPAPTAAPAAAAAAAQPTTAAAP